MILLNAGLRHGIANAAHELIRGAADQYEFIVISTALIDELRPQVTFIRIPTPSRPYSLRWLMFYCLAGLRLLFVRADLIHTMAPTPLVPNRVDLATVLFSQVAYYQMIGRATNVYERIKRACASLIENRSYNPRRVRMLAALSPGGKRELESHHPYLPVVVTPHVLQSERFFPDAAVRTATRAKLYVQEGDLVTCFVNNTYWHLKGLEIAIAGLACAAKSEPVLGTLWVVGAGPVNEFRKIASKYRIADKVRFLGPRGDIADLYRGADILVHPAAYETFSLVVHEAAASGLPIIATRTNGVEDLVQDGVAGILIERTVDAVADALMSLACNPKMREKMGRNGRERALRFGPRGFVDSTLGAYRKLMG